VFTLLAAGCSRSEAVDRPSTVRAVLAVYGSAVESEFRPICRRLGIAYPPRRLTLLAFKQERILEVWGANRQGTYKRLATYPILAASGLLGPKKREGDLQVPEGFYRLTHLNPLSQYHLSIRVDYPNREDIANSRIPRHQMGGDIYVHGNRVSIGCIAIGDSVIERVFCLTALSRASDRRILISPVDFRKGARPESLTRDPQLLNLYRRLGNALGSFRQR
jgi:murein L,D-transpeptidase YafK